MSRAPKHPKTNLRQKRTCTKFWRRVRARARVGGEGGERALDVDDLCDEVSGVGDARGTRAQLVEQLPIFDAVRDVTQADRPKRLTL